MATFETIRTWIRDTTEKGSAILTDSIMEGIIQGALERMERAHDWRGQEVTSGNLTYTSTSDGIALPSDFVAEVQVYQKDTQQSDPSRALTPVKKLPGGRQTWARAESSRDLSDFHLKPNDRGPFYWLWDEKLYYVPNPSADITLVIDYWQNLAALTTGSNFLTTLYPRTVYWAALVEAWHFLAQDDFAAQANGMFQNVMLPNAMKHNDSTLMSGEHRVRGT